MPSASGHSSFIFHAFCNEKWIIHLSVAPSSYIYIYCVSWLLLSIFWRHAKNEQILTIDEDNVEKNNKFIINICVDSCQCAATSRHATSLPLLCTRMNVCIPFVWLDITSIGVLPFHRHIYAHAATSHCLFNEKKKQAQIKCMEGCASARCEQKSQLTPSAN